MAAVTERPLDADLLDANIRRHDVVGPRYTSYPTADRFVEAYQGAQHLQALRQRGTAQPLSVYVHIPFCEQLCYYCACNKIITKHHERAAPYLAALNMEMDLVAEALGAGSGGVAPVSQLHLGGGSPTFLSDAELSALMDALRRRFKLLPGAELSIEVDPRTVDLQRLTHLRLLGFNRLSFGVQDFDSAVQKAVHRVQPLEQVARLMQQAKELGFASTNVDLIYGLPLQTPQSFARTIAQVAELRPDRIAMYAYAHLPQRFKPQRRIVAELLPPAGDKLAMLSGAISALLGEGYTFIGMDHFALPDDPLAVAKRQGLLHRGFQGYSTQPDCDLVGLGVSAISRVGATYAQNAKTLEEYEDALKLQQLPVQRGLALTRDDLLRRAVIMALMCQGRVEFESIAASYLVDVPTYFAPELTRLTQLAEQGLVTLEPGAIQVTPLGWYFVRAVALVFDRYCQADASRERFSKII
ncbi:MULTISPECIES: oxygen-independent coproporphyrinogen III oxidase [unclassified Roseateles]|uniref:oxygen-independent coproporphyrinogen III oxidase n=1 Tax=unclassified Roseateles TaxID=2626991 RepID=UPI0006F7DF00|nr:MULTISPECIES: oxygen-independent coproporphyrinogen III oxidase [unclassified Roseateles]KQW42376.1 coproporphyrinogen III oxidase [Pelomonas sp. Root405]KRA68250.1 coproporphyrinogen III oxidase [Pelomonas sp. Root662]